MRPVWEVFGHQGDGDGDPLDVVDGTLNLEEGGRQQYRGSFVAVS